MKAKTKLTKLWTILLSLVMLLSLLPTTALAATYAEVKVNGVSLGDGEYLTSNAATAASSSSTKPTTYVAWYKDGVLTLKNFTGKLNSSIVVQGAVAGDLTIKLIGDNTITPYDTGIQGIGSGGSITITADSGSNGKLTINMPNSERSAFGINGYASSVTIKGSADVTIIATATATNQESYGIKSNKAVSILDSASVSITCKTPNSSSRSDSCNGIYSDTGVTINTDGTIQIDVHEAGDEAYSYGINSMGTLTLTKVGEMTVKWKGKVYGAPLLPSSASFASDAYDTNVDEDACIATYKPKGTTSTTYTVSFDANGGTGTMANVTGVTGEYTLPANGFTAPSGKQFKAWSVGGSEKAVGDKITVTANTTVTAVWEDIPVVTYTVSFDANGGTGSMADVTGVSGEYMLPANGFTAPSGKQFKAWSVGGVEKAAGDTITVNANTTVTAIWENIPVVTYTVSFDANGGTGTMTDVTGVSGEYTLPANSFTAPDGKQFKAWSVGGVEKATGDKITVTANTTVTAVWEAIEYNVTVTGGTASVGAGTPITKATMGTTVTLTAGAAPTGQMFDKWVVNGVVVDDANSATTTFVMPAGNVTAEATYKNAPHTHTYNQETVKPEALKTPADCTSNAVYFKSCSCGAISTTDTFVAMNTALGHAYGSDWKYDSTNHWHECECGDKADIAAHSASEWIIDTAATETAEGAKHKECTVCKKVLETATIPATGSSHTHSYGTDWKYDDTNHWHECECGDKADIAAHSASEWIIDTAATETAEGAKHKECTVCKKVLETATIPATGSSHTHSYGTDWKYDDTNHWHECECGDKADIAAHSASEWIIDTAATETAEGAKHKECTVCKKVLETATIPATGSSHTNSYGVYVGMTYTAGNFIYQITSIDTATLGQSKVIGVVAAKKNKITKITIPDRADCKGYRLNVTAVGDKAFKSMKKLKKVTFGSNIKVIGKNAFSNCKKLNKISFKNITTIGNDAFAGCKALKKLTIGNKVTVIGKNAFKKCSKLETVVIGKAVKTISSKAFTGDNKIKKITFKGKKLKTVKKDAFSKKAKENIKSKKTKLKGNKKAIKLFKKKLKIK